MVDAYEDEQRILDPHRAEEQRSARQEVADRLRERGVTIQRRDSDDDVASVLESLERFDDAVQASGGDLMVNRIGADEPQDRAFVPPERTAQESAPDYRRRVDAAAAQLRERDRQA
ncbi:MAG: hypothetical protein ACT4R6_09020 [Gemmatimonadaceae bacterium]